MKRQETTATQNGKKWQNRQIFHVPLGNQNRNVPVGVHWHIWLVMVHLMLTSDSVSVNSDNDGVMIVKGMI